LARSTAEYMAPARRVGDPEELRAAGLMASTINALARRARPYQAKGPTQPASAAPSSNSRRSSRS
jgi:hypothetical protein